MYEERSGPRKIYWDCQVPIPDCIASLVPHSGPKSRDYKAHASREDAVRCAKKYAEKRNEEGDGIFWVPKPLMIKGGKGKRAMVPGIR